MAKIGNSTIADKHAKYRVRFIVDPDASFEECNGEPRPLTEEEYAEHFYMADNGTRQVPYAEYLQYYGNPARHVYVMCVYSVGCACCGHWTPDRHYLGGIDNMDDSPELKYIDTWYTPEEIDANKAQMGYFAEVAAEAFEEAKQHG